MNLAFHKTAAQRLSQFILAALVAALTALPAIAQEQNTARSSSAAARYEAGEVRYVKGDATVQTARAAVGSKVYAGDKLQTRTGGEMMVKMKDGGTLALRPNTEMRVEKYKADGEDDDESVFRLVRGGMRSITGFIARFNPDKYKIRTATATIGVRGTDHEPYVVLKGSKDGKPGTYDKVNAGLVVMRTSSDKDKKEDEEEEGEEFEITPGQTGFLALEPGAAVILLDTRPAFLDMSFSNQQDLDRIHDQTRGMLDALRNNVIEQRMGLPPSMRTPVPQQGGPLSPRDAQRQQRMDRAKEMQNKFDDSMKQIDKYTTPQGNPNAPPAVPPPPSLPSIPGK
jgi:hypothetical protein